MLESGRRHYVGFGSDIGGYDTDPNAGPLGRTKELFLRWTAIGALSSFMENGGDGEHFPWNEGTKVAIYRNGTLMQPYGDTEVLFSYAYFLGSHIYIVPILRDPVPNQSQRVWLPA
ncbi:unnamed protein product [Rotaria magnacalcarata]|uniref:Glycoside hydrolase family 31 TIM barrel domain-containing protein n=1 Tax=Rotaria magnacalcarata TaxID=392030 RepID=A0A819FGZ2_9BILA|nr:unnamed protein product [Rotaria magnacalcarata]CAF3864584.1 unnamed protein product [Rotaria magnacalcarata]CAF4138986.1 unnamed protein product [Rotaria magnacalcarata]